MSQRNGLGSATDINVEMNKINDYEGSSLVNDDNKNINILKSANNSSQDVGHGRFLKLLSLVCLVFQNCTAVLLMRWVKTEGYRFSTAVLVLAVELSKFCICFFLVAKANKFSMHRTIQECKGIPDESAAVDGSSSTEGANHGAWKKDCLKMLIPAMLYNFQNNILFVALANLEATLFQVLYQMKILFTAILMTLMLGRKLTVFKWISLGLLFSGVVLTQLGAQTPPSPDKGKVMEQSLALGIVACFGGALSSAFASVYFELALKTVPTTLMARNVQLAGFSIPLCFIVATMFEAIPPMKVYEELKLVLTEPLLLALVLVQVAGGLIVAAVIKYADNLLKGFATAIAIVVSGIFSYFFLDFIPTPLFMTGLCIVLCASVMYSMNR